MPIDLLTMLNVKPYGKRVSVEDLGLYILPQEFIPRNATFVDKTIESTIAAATTAIFFEYRVPANRRGVMRRLACDSASPGALPNLQFSVLRSGASVGNYQLEQFPIGSVNAPDLVAVQFDGDQLMQVQVTNLAAGFAFDVHVRVVAWFWDILVERGR